MAALSFCRSRISTMSRLASRLTAWPRAILSSSTIRARALVVFTSPAWNALPSSTPRRTFIPSAPWRWTWRRTLSTPSFWMSRFVARLLLVVIIASQSWRRLKVPPTDL
jgi:hypothetical protein